ncbi:MAG: virulence RhuM family protein, partial [Firmicutes bacterium]|nr:virulence RhuM family protein [Bacillota bacterium]
LLATLYGITVQGVGQHIKKVLNDAELTTTATVKKFFIVQNEGEREIKREIAHYNLQMIIAVGFKVNNEKAVQFRKWANQIVKEYTIKGWVMDDERLKNGGSVLTEKYFEQLLERIREIRLSERKFYQKITDIYATALDYDKGAKSTQAFFKKVQNKMHFAIHGNTAAEVIYNRADATKDHMGLTAWEAAPEGKIIKSDVTVAKNYLSKTEVASLNRIVSAYLDVAEDMAIRKIPMAMDDWSERLDIFLKATDRQVLDDAGTITTEIAKAHAEAEFEKYRIVQDNLFKSDYDIFLEQLLQMTKKDEE